MRYTNNKKLLFAFVCGFFVQWAKDFLMLYNKQPNKPRENRRENSQIG